MCPSTLECEPCPDGVECNCIEQVRCLVCLFSPMFQLNWMQLHSIYCCLSLSSSLLTSHFSLSPWTWASRLCLISFIFPTRFTLIECLFNYAEHCEKKGHTGTHIRAHGCCCWRLDAARKVVASVIRWEELVNMLTKLVIDDSIKPPDELCPRPLSYIIPVTDYLAQSC